MSEEIAAADANIREIADLRIRLQMSIDATHAAERERDQAEARERIAVEAYQQQQNSERELEAIYQAALVDLMQVRAALDVALRECEIWRERAPVLTAIVQLARAGFGTEEDIGRGYAFDPTSLTAAIRRYDALMKS